ncbi:hypothetical protein CKO44_00075 [Rubrivivax gelatinosus]|uniref:Septum formation-related domain-containing protein n=1 Tax=Rubrivivax gelatinosus TaxID=28068 RepID=A0ABS1DNE2_RUBGE|nr:hypothetical protein [Rubrivivax gelatinosus]MBK1611866.1 hypothetical protein [Rubrivivax gelatinosus]MBK1711523.1 hypothetical protein [Rubrivivax gelatinosus]MBZ8143895.1 hypothetical protein [Rubrivivax gelatinosus]
MNKAFSFALVTALAVASSHVAAQGPAQAVQRVTAQCTTDATGGDGVRHDCDSAPTVITAPEGFVFIKDGPKGLAGGKTSENGSEHECRYDWSDFVEVVPGYGITQPRTFTLQAHARSPHGHFSGRGWVVCEYHLTLSALPRAIN